MSSSQTAASPVARRPLWRLAVLVLILAVAAYAGWSRFRPLPPRDLAAESALQLDLTRPDALIESVSLSALPRDLLKVPLLRDLLSEDFVFYYEQHTDRLGLAGTLRRIAYEHELDLRDTLIQELLDQPADIALWRAPDGKLQHALLALQRGALAKVLQPLAQVALDDRQLSPAGMLHVSGREVPLYRLRFNAHRQWLLASHGDRLVLLTDTGMLQESEPTDTGEEPGPRRLAEPAVKVVEQVLADDSPFEDRFGLPDFDGQHRITLSADYMALGYGHFLSSLEGLRFDMDAQGWNSHLALRRVRSGPTPDFKAQIEPLWQSMPMGAAACVALPVSARHLRPVLERFMADSPALVADVASQLGSVAGVCWYGGSRLYTPLFVMRLENPWLPALDQPLRAMFDALVGAVEPHAETGRFAVVERPRNSGRSWQRTVSSRFGLHPAAKAEQPEQLAASHFFRVSLARHGDRLLFSLDDTLVRDALATLDKRYPPLSERLPAGMTVPLYLAPHQLAQLFEREALASLPPNMEAIFRNAAERHLLPRLRTLAEHAPLAVTLPPAARARGDWTWLPLTWQAL